MTLHISDPIWGDVALDEPVLEALIASRPVQRLNGIHQAGASYYIAPETRTVTRYEHSAGVMLLLRALGAPLDEQVAGLLHDVPHTAFSHTVDIVFPNDEHNFHERFQRDIVMSSEIPAILQQHGVPLSAALEPDHFPLLDQPLPDLCADRLDYCLRDMVSLGHATRQQTLDFLTRLLPASAGILVTSIEAAAWFAGMFVRANAELYTAPDDAGAYWALAGAIRQAYSTGEFSDRDLFSTDDAAMARLEASGDPIVRAYLDLLKTGAHFKPVQDSRPFFLTRMKQRVVDPLVLEPGWQNARRLSRVSPEYAATLASLDSGPVIHYRLWPDGQGAELARLLEGR